MDPNRLFPVDEKTRSVAKSLYNAVCDLPIISPHGHCDPKWFAENEKFPDPTELFVTPDHYIFRMLVSQGYSLDQLGINTIKKNDDEYHFNVTRCKYAEMYNEMGLKDIGQLLSCNRDYNFSVGFDKNLILERKKTIMEGHSCCTFRYSNKEKT